MNWSASGIAPRQRAGLLTISRDARKAGAVLTAALLLVGALTVQRGAIAGAATVATPIGMYSGTENPVDKSEDDANAVELGIRFTVSVAGTIVGARYYKSVRNTGVHTATLWRSSGARLATSTFAHETAQGWQTVRFARPISLDPGQIYVISYHTNSGHYAQLEGQFSHHRTVGGSVIRGTQGVYHYGGTALPASSWHNAGYYVDALFQPGHSTAPPTTAPPTTAPPTTAPPTTAPPTTAPPTTAPPTTAPPTTAPPTTAPSAGFPGASNTGVPAGTKLRPSQGFRTTTDGQIVDGLDVTGTIYVDNKNVVIRNSRIKSDEGAWAVDIGRNGPASLLIVDSELDANKSDQGGIRNQSNGSSWVGQRLNIHNGENGARLGGHATLDDSWLHDFVSDSSAPHYDGVEVYEGSDNVIRHNTIDLNQDETSCVNVQGDFGAISNVVIDDNLLNGGGWNLNIRGGGANPVAHTSITGNHFGGEYGYGYGAIDAPSTTILHNVLDPAHTNIDSLI